MCGSTYVSRTERATVDRVFVCVRIMILFTGIKDYKRLIRDPELGNIAVCHIMDLIYSIQ